MGKFGCGAVVCALLIGQSSSGQAPVFLSPPSYWVQQAVAVQEWFKKLHEDYVLECDSRMRELEEGRGSTDFLLEALLNRLQIELLLSQRKPDRVAAYATHLDRMRRVNDRYQEDYRSGRFIRPDWSVIRGGLVQAERWLNEAKAQPE